MKATNVHKLKEIDRETLDNITADVPTNELRSSGSKLSFWSVDSLGKLEEAALAIALSGQRLEDIQIVAIDREALEQNFSLEESEGQTAAKFLKNTHIDVCDITHKKLLNLLQYYKDAIEQNHYFRYRTKEIKEIVRRAKLSGGIDYEMSSERLKEDINRL